MDEFDCMQMIHAQQADLVNVDAGLASYGSNLYTLRPIAVENYAASNEQGLRDLFYYATMVVPIANSPQPSTLRGKEICSAGELIHILWRVRGLYNCLLLSGDV